jgi:hypothetical protein
MTEALPGPPYQARNRFETERQRRTEARPRRRQLRAHGPKRWRRGCPPRGRSTAEAHRLRKLARTGVNVLAERGLARRTVSTFEQAAKKVHEQRSPSFGNAKHRAQWLASFATDVFPTIGSKRVDTIDSADALRVPCPIWTTKPENDPSSETANEGDTRLGEGLWERTGANPTDGLKEVLPKHRAVAKHHRLCPTAP